jgi:hypothetical protein
LAKARIDVKLDKAEIGKIMKGPELAAFLLELAEDVATKAGPEFEARTSNARKSRVISIALDPSPNAKFKEMNSGRLARALGEATR